MSPGNCWGHTFLGLQKAHVLSVLTAGWICHRGTFRERESGLSWSGGPAGLGSGARPLHGGDWYGPQPTLALLLYYHHLEIPHW